MSEKEHEELLAMYQIAVDDIRDSKHQQWSVIHLTLLAIAAVVAIPSISYIEKCGVKVPVCLLRFLVWFIGVTGIVFIGSFAYSLSKFRKKKETIREHFVETVRKIEEYKFGGPLVSCFMKEFLQTTTVFAIIFMAFIGFAIYIALSILR
jgi:hypothetical protein